VTPAIAETWALERSGDGGGLVSGLRAGQTGGPRNGCGKSTRGSGGDRQETKRDNTERKMQW